MTADSQTQGTGALTFSILRRGDDKPSGPHSQENILQMLQDGKISRKDFVFYEGMSDWQPLDEVFDIQEEINGLFDDGQDREKLKEAFQEVENILAQGEEVYYIAIQERAGILTKTRQSVAVSNQHLYHLTEKEVGYEIEAHLWKNLTSVAADERGGGSGVFTFIIDNKRRIDIGNLPMGQVESLLRLSQELAAAHSPKSA